MRALKILSGVFLIISLTLPLSTCRGPAREGSTAAPPAIERYVISEQGQPAQWLWGLLFLFPLILALSLKKPPTIAKEAVSLISLVPVFYVVWWHSTTGKLALGGYLALAGGLGYACAAVFSLVRFRKGPL